MDLFINIDILFFLISKNDGVVVRGFTSIFTSASIHLEYSEWQFCREAVKPTLVISIAKARVVVSNVAGSTESADEPEGFECEILSYHMIKLHFHMS